MTDPVHKTYLGLAIDYAKSVNNRQVECGGYDCRTRTVCIKNEFVCAEAGLPDKLRPQFVHALRHEYGHALTQDLLTVKYAAKPMANKSYQTLDEANQPREVSRVSVLVAPPLKPVVKDWQAAPSTIYGLEHNTDCFSEYLAESYARVPSRRRSTCGPPWPGRARPRKPQAGPPRRQRRPEPRPS